MNDAINASPQVTATEISVAIPQEGPTHAQLQQLGSSLLSRHLSLPGLKPVVSSEEIVEAYYRCVLTERLTKRYALAATAVANCINSSHRAVRRVCVSSGHSHASIEDRCWQTGWDQMRQSGVGIREASRRSARHADLYVVANKQIVSVEFKYLNSKGLQDVAGCAAQFNLHARHYAEAVLVLYSGAGAGVLQVERELRELVEADNTRIISVAGPEIAIMRHAA